ncbi:MAG: CHAT domain-containing protein, partial [Balneolales bacterium]|nr:CHAT domain-containing protein [Balneolales bacterium]
DYFSNTLGKHILFKRVVFATQIQGYYQTALNFYRNDLIPLSESIMDAEEYLRVRMDYASILFRLGAVKSALEVYQSIDEHPHQLQDERYISALLNNLAVSYLNAGYFDNYLTLQIRAYEQANRSNSHTAQLRILNNLYIYHWRNQEWNAALQYLDLALLVAQEHDLIQELADIYVLYGTYYRSKEQDYDRAINLFELSLSLIDKESDFRTYTNTVSELIFTFDDAGRIDDAKSRRLQLLDEVIERNDIQLVLELKSQLIDSYLDLNDFETATQYYNDIKNLDRDNLDFRLKVRVTNSIFRYLTNMGDDDQAFQIMLPLTSEIITNIRSSGDIQSGSIRIEPGFVKSFELLIDNLLKQNRAKEAIVWLDEFKNLNKAAYVNSSLLKSTILSEEEFLYDIQLSNQIEQLRSEYSTAEPTQRFAINNELLKLLDEKNRINNKVLQNYTTEPLRVSDVQRNLSRNEQILSFTALDSIMYVTSITRNTIEVNRLRITSEDEDLAIAIIDGLNETRANLHQLNDVYERFFAEYINEQTSRLLIVPDYFLYQIPAEILPVARTTGPFNYGSASYLIEKMSVSYQNSLSDIVAQSRRARNTSYSTNFVGMAVSNFDQNMGNLQTQPILNLSEENIERTRNLSNLPYAKIEIERSYSLLDWLPNRKMFIDSEGTKSNLLSHATDTRILHIASHSEVHSADPLFSVIHLHPDSESAQNGHVYAYELFNLNLKSELIVLSSCDSGGGSFVQGSGIIGLGRALNFAGANSLILNMWSIRDQAAAELMTSFYEEAKGNTDKDAALREAKVRYINSVNSDPAVWGSLILFGDTAPVSEPWPWVRTSALTLMLLLALVLVRRSYTYRK